MAKVSMMTFWSNDVRDKPGPTNDNPNFMEAVHDMWSSLKGAFKLAATSHRMALSLAEGKASACIQYSILDMIY